MRKTLALSLMLVTSICSANTITINELPEEIQAIQQDKTYTANVLEHSRLIFKHEPIPNNEAFLDEFYRDLLRAKMVANENNDRQAMALGLLHRTPYFDQYQEEANPLRQRKLIRENVIPNLESIAEDIITEFHENKPDYILMELSKSHYKTTVQYDPLSVSIANGILCPRDEGYEINMERHQKNSPSVTIKFNRPSFSDAKCSSHIPLTDEDVAIDIIDRIQAGAKLRVYFKVLSYEPTTKQLNVINSEIDTFMIGVEIFDSKGTVAYIGQSDDKVPPANSKTASSSAIKDLPLTCDVKDIKTTGFLTLDTASGKQFIGDIDPANVINNIVEHELNHPEVNVKLINKTDTSATLHQYTSVKKYLTVTYTVEEQWLTSDIAIPDGVMVSKSGFEEGFCTLVNNI